MNPLRVSVSHVEQFRKVCETEYATEAELLAYVRKAPFKASWYASCGTAWHEVLRRPERYLKFDDKGKPFFAVYPRGQSEPYTFEHAEVEAAVAHIGEGGMWEMKHTRVIKVPATGHTIELVMKVDWMRGLVIQDNKTKFSDATPDEFLNSVQWRLYLFALEGVAFRYNLWPMGLPRQPRIKGVKVGKDRPWGHCKLRGDPVYFTCWPYPEMERDCMYWITRFMEWTERRGVTRFLQQ